VGGDPSRGEPYGYIAWNGEQGILSVRNPSPGAAEIIVPFDSSDWYRGATGTTFRARVIYPYQAEWPAEFTSGQPMHIIVPGYSVMTFQLAPGHTTATTRSNAPPAFTNVLTQTGWHVNGMLPNETMQRCDLLVITPQTPSPVRLNGNLIPPDRTNRGNGWQISAFDLRNFKGTKLEISLESGGKPVAAWLLMDRPVADGPADPDPRLPAPIAQGFRRETQLLLNSTNNPPTVSTNPPTLTSVGKWLIDFDINEKTLPKMYPPGS
jgi:hypothetical protein